MADIGLKVIIDGRQLTSQQARDYSLWSKQSVMKTFKVITIGYTFASDLNAVTLSIPHGLKYRPACWINFTEATHIEWNNFDIWRYYQGSGENQTGRFWKWTADNNQIQIKYSEVGTGVGINPTGEKWEFKLYIFINPIE